MTDGIKRDPEAKRREDQWLEPRALGGCAVVASTVAMHDRATPVRVLPWPTAADGDGVTEPPTMDEVWPGRLMMSIHAEIVKLSGAPPVWCTVSRAWRVLASGEEGGVWHIGWRHLTPITPTTRLTVETTDPDEVRRRLGEVGRIVEGDDA